MTTPGASAAVVQSTGVSRKLHLTCIAYVTASLTTWAILLAINWASLNLGRYPWLWKYPTFRYFVGCERDGVYSLWYVSPDLEAILVLLILIGLPLIWVCRRSYWGVILFWALILACFGVVVCNMPDPLRSKILPL
jgi:hypothetical protein